MTDDSRERLIAILARAEPESKRLVSELMGRCWPGGTADRMELGALEWVRRSGPRGVGCLPPACSCAAGRCCVCN